MLSSLAVADELRGVARPHWGRTLRLVLAPAVRLLTPVVSVFGLWYLAIAFSGLPAFVIPRPERVLDTLVTDRAFIAVQLWSTLQVAGLGFIAANVAGVGLAVPHIVAAQEITGSGSVIVAISAEWMISSTGLGYVINRALQTYRGDQVYAVALIATALSFAIYALVHWVGRRLDWRAPAKR